MESWNLLLILKIATYGQTYEWCIGSFYRYSIPSVGIFCNYLVESVDK